MEMDPASQTDPPALYLSARSAERAFQVARLDIRMAPSDRRGVGGPVTRLAPLESHLQMIGIIAEPAGARSVALAAEVLSIMDSSPLDAVQLSNHSLRRSARKCQGRQVMSIGLGLVDIRLTEGDSPRTANQIQGWKTEASLGSRYLERCTMGAGCAAAAGQGRRPRSLGRRQPTLSRSGALDCPDRLAVARSARGFRELEFGLQAFPPMGVERRLRKGFQ